MTNPIRKENRVQAVLPVRISGIDVDGEPFQGLGHTLNVSPNGARLSGVRLPLREGCVVRIQRTIKAASFRVVWIGKPGTPTEGQMGVECLEPVKNFWGIERLQPVSKDEERSAARRRQTVNRQPAAG